MTKLKTLLYDHEFRNPVATSSLAYQELAKLAAELERELAEKSRLISEMEKGFIIESKTNEY